MSQHSFEERFFSAIGYIGVLFLIPLLLRKESRYCQFHGKQGLALFIAWGVNTVILIIPFFGMIISFVGSILLFILSVLGVIKAYLGEEWKMPYIHELVKKLKL